MKTGLLSAASFALISLSLIATLSSQSTPSAARENGMLDSMATLSPITITAKGYQSRSEVAKLPSPPIVPPTVSIETSTNLTEQQKVSVLKAALQTREVSSWLEKGIPYRSRIAWMTNRGSNWEINNSRIRDAPNLDTTSTIHPAAIFGFGSPQVEILGVAVDLAPMRPVHVVSITDVPRHDSGLSYLSDNDRTKLLKVASDAARLTGRDADTAELIWTGLKGDGWEYTFEYDAVEVGIFEGLWSPNLQLYPGVRFRLGGYIREVTVDLDRNRVIVAHEYPVMSMSR